MFFISLHSLQSLSCRSFISIKSGKEDPFQIGAYALPQRIRCAKCRGILYEDKELKSPYEIIETYSGRCPKCHRKLSSIPTNVEVKRMR